MSGGHNYSPEERRFIEENAPGRRVKELHQMFVDEFGPQVSLIAIKSYLSNHHIITGTYRKYTNEHIDWLRENVQGTRFNELTRMFNDRFAFNISVAAMVSLCDKYGLHNGIDCRFNPAMVEAGKSYRFPKGNVPFNKGKKGISYPGMEATQFKKGNMPHSWRPVGTESLRSDGYIWVKIAEPHTWKEKHRLIWEAANGPIPKGHKVIFGDGNRLNTTLDNLILITDAQMARLNQRGLIGDSAELTRAGIIVADIISKSAERRRGAKKKRKRTEQQT